jgi:Spy/CpxP family protein refolding chaperone
MKRWIKRSLFGFAGAALLAGSLSSCAWHRHHGWAGTEQEQAEFRAKMIERVSGKLDLDAAQKQKLTVLTDKLQAQRAALRGGGDPRSEFHALFAGAKLDQERARKLVEDKTAAVQAGSPDVITAAADFFDNLNPAQQQKVREFMQRRRGG